MWAVRSQQEANHWKQVGGGDWWLNNYAVKKPPDWTA